MRLVLTEGLPQESVAAARERLVAAADDLDTNRVAALIVELARVNGLVRTWEQVCVPLLSMLPGRTAAEIAVEHALSEGIRAGLDVFGSSRRWELPTEGVLLAGAEQEHHCLGLHALAAALREQGRGCLLLGAALPWPALASAVRRARPRTVVVWSQTAVTGRAYRLVRFSRDFPGVRVFGAGPGWSGPLPAPADRLDSLTHATALL
ncbi:cobalamin-dependent protein [Micromonospora echinofusca]|uniref:Transcriptional regulator n=1 Tax=Micromonospora echinofusca TaxID=47858 RepID=A0ABS3VK84_MICEH|nr:cobalamin-dependent protein [Micromonospora echinofusca]MBO4204935.1 transcriptional regulator [Micromonospora echinofusca]